MEEPLMLSCLRRLASVFIAPNDVCVTSYGDDVMSTSMFVACLLENHSNAFEFSAIVAQSFACDLIYFCSCSCAISRLQTYGVNSCVGNWRVYMDSSVNARAGTMVSKQNTVFGSNLKTSIRLLSIQIKQGKWYWEWLDGELHLSKPLYSWLRFYTHERCSLISVTTSI